MFLRSGLSKNKMANNRHVESDQETELEQENFNVGEARGLLNSETTVSNARGRQSATQNSTGKIPKIINRSAGCGRGFMQTDAETVKKKRTVPNTSNQSFRWDCMDLPFPAVSKSTKPQPDSNDTFPIDFFFRG